MDYPCGKFGDCIFSRFGLIVRTNKHTHGQAESHSDTTVVGVSNELQ